MVSMILLHDMIIRRVVISLWTYYYTTILRTNTNAMTRTEGDFFHKMEARPTNVSDIPRSLQS